MKAPWPVVRFENMPSRNVANSGAFTKANTNCRKSMMLLKRVARYAASTEATIPKIVAILPTWR